MCYVEDENSFDNCFVRKVEESKMIDMSDLCIDSNPYLSHEGFSKKVLDPNLDVSEMVNLLNIDLVFIVNSIITGSDSNFKYLINNKNFRDALLEMASNGMIDRLNGLYITRIIFDYVNTFGTNPSSEDIIKDLFKISIKLYPKHFRALKSFGFDDATISMLLIARNSTDDQKISICRFNDVLIHSDINICTVKNIKDMYLALFDIEEIFSAIMFDIKNSFVDEDSKKIYRNISLALLEALESCSPSTISKILWDYSLSIPMGVPVRFCLKNSPIGPNTTSIIKMLGSRGVYIR